MTRLYRRATLAFLLLILVFFGGPVPRAQAPTPNIKVEGDHFTINGEPKYLIFVSYFDALRSEDYWSTDLQWLADNHIDGVRIFPNWWHWCTPGGPTTANDDAVISQSGNINDESFKRLKRFLSAAAAKNIVVDISFTRGTSGLNPPMTLAQYRTAQAVIAERIADYRNVFIDVANEFDKNGEYTPDEVGTIVQAIHNGLPGPPPITTGDPNRAVTASTTTDYPNPGNVAGTQGFHFVAPHAKGDNASWSTDTVIGAQLDGVRLELENLGLVKPIHMQETPSFDRGCTDKDADGDISHAGDAVKREKQHGAAGFTFHNRASFDLAGRSLQTALTPAERGAIQSLHGLAEPTVAPFVDWFVAAFALTPANVGSAGGASAIALTRLAHSTADWRASTTTSWLHLSALRGSGLSVGFTADANPNTTARVGEILVSGRTVNVTQAAAAPASTAYMSVDFPASGAVAPPYAIVGWAVDTAAPNGTGVDAVHVWAFPASGPAVFVGVGTLGGNRPDVGGIFGSRFTPSGFSLVGQGLPAGAYQLVVYAHSTATNTFNQSQTVSITVPAPNVQGSIDAPVANASVTSPFLLGGWFIDLASGSGTGIDTIHVWAYPNWGSNQAPIFLGAPTMGGSRPDVGAAYGNARFTPSGYNLAVSTLGPGTHLIVVYPHSVVSNDFVAARTVLITVQ